MKACGGGYGFDLLTETGGGWRIWQWTVELLAQAAALEQYLAQLKVSESCG